MPVHSTKGGFQWGNHGHVYPTRAGAERQARAAYANGYRGMQRGGLVPTSPSGFPLAVHTPPPPARHVGNAYHGGVSHMPDSARSPAQKKPDFMNRRFRG